MKRKLVIFSILLWAMAMQAYAQFPGDKSNDNFYGVDSTTYAVGDVLIITAPQKGTRFASIFRYARKSFLGKAVDAINSLAGGDSAGNNSIVLADLAVRNYKSPILYFRRFTNEKGQIKTFAILKFNSSDELAVDMDQALLSGEIQSKSPTYNATHRQPPHGIDTPPYVKSFSANFNVRLISAVGSIQNQTVTLNFEISHNLPSQEVCLDCSASNSFIKSAAGNTYKPLEAYILSGTHSTRTFSKTVCGIVAKGAKVKCGMVFKPVLSDVKALTIGAVKVSYKGNDQDVFDSKSGIIELNNIKIDWR
ncbi:hypothetical protein [Porphyromonas pogonae]|uniref:hypothetical protein n=1 Tax=Porphyromonas pogonae TaxID=867595 RepID=UPI002E79C8BB|nr:hypothetical protein [Porphyromonas pogonae]